MCYVRSHYLEVAIFVIMRPSPLNPLLSYMALNLVLFYILLKSGWLFTGQRGTSFWPAIRSKPPPPQVINFEWSLSMSQLYNVKMHSIQSNILPKSNNRKQHQLKKTTPIWKVPSSYYLWAVLQLSQLFLTFYMYENMHQLEGNQAVSYFYIPPILLLVGQRLQNIISLAVRSKRHTPV